MDPFNPPQINNPQKRAADVQRAELERKSRDLYKIFNPTNQPFEVVLNAKISPEVWTIPAKEGNTYGELIVPNYVRVKYLEEMSQKIITIKSDRMVLEENEKRQSKGFDKMNLHTEQFSFENRNLKNLMSKREQIVRVLDGGLIKEYGIGSENNRPANDRQSKEEFEIAPEVLNGSPKIEPAESPKQPLNDPFDYPAMQDQTMIEEEDDNGIRCGICGKEFKAEIGLSGHMRSHK